MQTGHGSPKEESNTAVGLNPLFSRPGEATEFPRFVLPDGESLPETAYQVVHDESMLDGNARLNLATFVGTWMDEPAKRLYAEAADKNMIDKDEYPQTAAIETRCWRMLADLWNAPDPPEAIGTSTIGSSEACLLGGLALKRRWQHLRKAAGKPADRPNLVLSSAVQVCSEKFCNYWDVEARFVPLSQEQRVFDGHDLDRYVDENTIGVVAITGVTYTGLYEPVQQIAAALDAIQARTGLDVPIHVDGASGAMIAPFLQPQIEWDFRLKRVASINTSGHEYGLVYPGLGWIVWRSEDRLPEDLVFKVSYLGGDMPTFALNFSRPGAQVLMQYYLFLRLGFEGYRTCSPPQGTWPSIYQVRSAAWRPSSFGATALTSPSSPGSSRTDTPSYWNLHHLSERLRMSGWLVPAYPMPDALSVITVQRIVVRNGFTRDLAGSFLADLQKAVAYLDAMDGTMPATGHSAAFHH
ncbi:glutamate decarboxylase [Arthrobacter sp. A5]|uniref:glutamate decarboxylase n=1 Tax=Arthrobacter sp. A5 TaxID=576926 RepID=UPI003DA90B9D